MKVIGLITVLIAAVLACGGLAILPRVWRNQWMGLDPDRPPSGWPWGGPIWRGLVRTYLLGVVSALLGAPLVLFEFDLLNPEWAEQAVVGLGSAIAVIAFVLGPGVVLFNWPKFLVPPHLRAQPGAVWEWQGESPKPVDPPTLPDGRQAEPRPGTGLFKKPEESTRGM